MPILALCVGLQDRNIGTYSALIFYVLTKVVVISHSLVRSRLILHMVHMALRCCLSWSRGRGLGNHSLLRVLGLRRRRGYNSLLRVLALWRWLVVYDLFYHRPLNVVRPYRRKQVFLREGLLDGHIVGLCEVQGFRTCRNVIPVLSVNRRG